MNIRNTFTPGVRAWLYNVGIAVGAACVTFGIIDADKVGAIGGVLAALCGLARANVTPSTPDYGNDAPGGIDDVAN